jgi:Receptor family ligand binding region
LSGSNFTLLLFCVLLSACNTQKGLKDGPASEDPNGAKIYNPRTGQYEMINDPLTLVDTVDWIKDNSGAPPIGAAANAPSGKKEVYEIGILIPLKSGNVDFTDRIDARSRRFLNYYSGVKMALEDLSGEGILIDAKIHDTHESVSDIEEQLISLKKADAIIGPYNRQCLAKAAEFADNHKIPVFSPWTPSLKIKKGSDYFIQIVPGLATHADAAMRFASEQFDTAKFFLVATPENQNESRITLYEEAFLRYNPNKEPMEKLVIDAASVVPDSNDLTTIYVPDMINVFVMPYYQRTDEEFVNDFIRKVHAEHAEVEVVVIGLPQWMNFRNMNPDHLEDLNTYVTAVQFVDNTDDKVQDFNERFFEKFASIPEPAAWRGYELTKYIGESLNKYGSGFLTDISSEVNPDFRISPVFAGEPRPEQSNKIQYFENKGVEILLFVDQQFHRFE